MRVFLVARLRDRSIFSLEMSILRLGLYLLRLGSNILSLNGILGLGSYLVFRWGLDLLKPPGLGHQFGRALLKPRKGEERPG